MKMVCEHVVAYFILGCNNTLPQIYGIMLAAASSTVASFNIADVEGNGDCLFQAISRSEMDGRTPNRDSIRLRAAELRILANDWLCPNGKPSDKVTGPLWCLQTPSISLEFIVFLYEKVVDGLPVEMVMEPLNGEGRKYDTDSKLNPNRSSLTR